MNANEHGLNTGLVDMVLPDRDISRYFLNDQRKSHVKPNYQQL